MRNSRKTFFGLLVASVAFLAARAVAVSASEPPVSGAADPAHAEAASEVAPPEIDEPTNEAELEDLQTIANQSGITLQAAIDRYAWNDNFALAVAKVREAFPGAFAGAKIVDADHAWVTFARNAPEAARDLIDSFISSHSGVSVDVHSNLGFTEVELQMAIEAVHFAVLERPEVLDASTSHDFETGQITTIVVLESTVSDSVLDALRAVATKSLLDAGGVGVLDSIAISVVRSKAQVLGGNASNTEHLGGENISCTSGFVVRSTTTGLRGVSTAGHCSNFLTDDGVSLTFRGEHEGTHGDFQWHSGTQPTPDDFYSGNSSSTEVNRRDVSSVGSPSVGQSLCKNGVTTHKSCDVVRKLNVCVGSICNLVQMETRTVQSGDSGGPWFWSNTAYGITRGWHTDPFPWNDRDDFSRADRIDDALGVVVATT